MRVRHVLSACFCGLLVAAGAAAADGENLPLLKDTVLYTQTASGCWGVELEKGKNPILKILNNYKIAYYDVEMCNEGTYPIVHPIMIFDPEENVKYDYRPFFTDLVRQNGYSPLSVVDEKRGKILNLSWTKTHDLHIETELYDTQDH